MIESGLNKPRPRAHRLPLDTSDALCLAFTLVLHSLVSVVTA